jgi:antitoxin VapB
MALSIKSEYADGLAREIAAITGESITRAVTTALEEKLAQVQKRKDTEVARKLALIKRIQQRVKKAHGNKPMPSSKALFDALYDERGLPK